MTLRNRTYQSEMLASMSKELPELIHNQQARNIILHTLETRGLLSSYHDQCYPGIVKAIDTNLPQLLARRDTSYFILKVVETMFNTRHASFDQLISIITDYVFFSSSTPVRYYLRRDCDILLWPMYRVLSEGKSKLSIKIWDFSF